MTIKRKEFNKRTREVIAGRAGYRCSYPSCNKTLVGPGIKTNEWITVGEFSHIFSAKKNGPRTSGNLNKEELKKPENGIYLCRNHHKIIDSKSQDNKYTPDLLTRFKNSHEFKISAEIGEYIYPLIWIKNVEFSGGIFQDKIDLTLGKLTFITGTNGTGKSTITEIIASVFKQKIHSRWQRNSKFQLKISLDNSVMSDFEMEIEKNSLKYKIQEKEYPFVPFDFSVLYIGEGRLYEDDDLKTISSHINKDKSFVENLIMNTSLEEGIFTKKISLQEEDNIKKLYVQKGDIVVSFRSLSSSEKSSAILDLIICHAAQKSKFKSVLLIIDWSDLNNFADSTLKPYLEFLQTSSAHFQTLFVSHKERPNLDWTGWVIAKLYFDNNKIKLNQTEK